MAHNTSEPEAIPHGIKTGRRVIGYSAVIRTIDNGGYDRNTANGMRMVACIWEAAKAGWITLSVEKEIILWRWLVVTVFVNEEREKNGTVEVPNEEGGIDTAVIYSGKSGAMSVYPSSDRFALANHVEAIAIEKYGREEGLPLALRMYQEMVDVHPEKGFALSAFGRESLNMLHDSFIEQIQTDGMPEMPVTH
ncbi:hypothetical protein ACVQMG_000531 [Enterobacter roggenkampii]